MERFIRFIDWLFNTPQYEMTPMHSLAGILLVFIAVFIILSLIISYVYIKERAKNR